jgi:hypothetical protein
MAWRRFSTHLVEPAMLPVQEKCFTAPIFPYNWSNAWETNGPPGKRNAPSLKGNRGPGQSQIMTLSKKHTGWCWSSKQSGKRAEESAQPTQRLVRTQAPKPGLRVEFPWFEPFSHALVARRLLQVVVQVLSTNRSAPELRRPRTSQCHSARH